MGEPLLQASLRRLTSGRGLVEGLLVDLSLTLSEVEVVSLSGTTLAGEHDGPVEGVRQSAVAAADHHGADDELAERGELAG